MSDWCILWAYNQSTEEHRCIVMASIKYLWWTVLYEGYRKKNMPQWPNFWYAYTSSIHAKYEIFYDEMCAQDCLQILTPHGTLQRHDVQWAIHNTVSLPNDPKKKNKNSVTIIICTITQGISFVYDHTRFLLFTSQTNSYPNLYPL